MSKENPTQVETTQAPEKESASVFSTKHNDTELVRVLGCGKLFAKKDVEAAEAIAKETGVQVSNILKLVAAGKMSLGKKTWKDIPPATLLDLFGDGGEIDSYYFYRPENLASQYGIPMELFPQVVGRELIDFAYTALGVKVEIMSGGCRIAKAKAIALYAKKAIHLNASNAPKGNA